MFIIMMSVSSFTCVSINTVDETLLTLTWICTTCVLQISTGNLFISDYRQGILEQYFIQPVSSHLIIAFKIFNHWLLFGVSMSIIAAIFHCFSGESMTRSLTLGISLLFNTLIIINISAVGHALMIGQENLTSEISQILILPLIMPTFIYFKLLAQCTSVLVTTYMLFITLLICIIVIVNSALATHMALRYAIEQD
ncbi:heme exporter protein CcmB [Wolbachia endosymbiont of Howardula sp.]|uniref:heme exporter protein CcmB n=1 Tax=Wolbachia endosymbiont of Howardula sp. TaxID=2916816 RepID=UPI00217DF175|nr:heme exporter protein CcmB [Wolbachia endosymbiont of Howardula sp.]UWI83255.1 heme exporter protein CcmB [Wolbachia endosymbiont of Howardula sp.]